jgi:hypothetical protein
MSRAAHARIPQKCDHTSLYGQCTVDILCTQKRRFP